MPWVKVSSDAPDCNDWLVCNYCGWLTLKSRPPNIYGCEIGDNCKYCENTMKQATIEDMQQAYPSGQYEWQNMKD